MGTIPTNRMLFAATVYAIPDTEIQHTTWEQRAEHVAIFY